MNMKTETMGSITGDVASELSNGRPNVRSIVFVALGVWFGLVFFLASQGAFVGSVGSPPLPIFFGVAIPLALFFALYFGLKSFRDFILGADLRFVAAIEAWRWGGLGFLSLYANGILPGLFALPAGLGDMAIGISAPWLVLSLVRNRLFAASRRFVIWNILGIADFVVAVLTPTQLAIRLFAIPLREVGGEKLRCAHQEGTYRSPVSFGGYFVHHSTISGICCLSEPGIDRFTTPARVSPRF